MVLYEMIRDCCQKWWGLYQYWWYRGKGRLLGTSTLRIRHQVLNLTCVCLWLLIGSLLLTWCSLLHIWTFRFILISFITTTNEGENGSPLNNVWIVTQCMTKSVSLLKWSPDVLWQVVTLIPHISYPIANTQLSSRLKIKSPSISMLISW